MNNQWKLVPVEPTREMLVAALKTNGACPIYAAMLAAAPEPSAGWEPEVVAVINEEGGHFKETVVEHRPGIDRLPVGTELVDRAHVIRLQAERDALQLRLNAADQRIDELTAQKAESRMITLSGCEFSEHELLRTAVRMVTGTSRRGTQRWVAMKDAFCCGSGVAHALCRRFGFDPDETVKP